MEDKIILKFKTKNILNFYEIEPRSNVQRISPMINAGSSNVSMLQECQGD